MVANCKQLNWIALFLTAFVLSRTSRGASAVGTDKFRLEVSESVVKVNTTVVFTCRIKEADQSTPMSFNKVARTDVAVRDFIKEPISNMAQLTTLYRNLHRFSIVRTTEDLDIVYRLTINGTAVEDTGTYSCSDMNDYAIQKLEVYRLPDTIQFDDHDEGEVVDLAEGEKADNLTCTVLHFAPEADLKVTVGSRDVTGDFLVASSPNVLCSNVGVSSKDCPLHINYNMTAEPREFKPSFADDGQDMTCSLTMRDFEKDQFKTTVRLNVKHKPRISCKYPISVRLNQTLVRVNCMVHANPFPNNVNRTWIINRGTNNEIRINAPYQSNDYLAEETDVRPNAVNVILVINKFLRAFFRNTYHLEVVNEFGNSTEYLTFKELIGGTGGGARQQPSFHVSLWIGLVALVSSALLH